MDITDIDVSFDFTTDSPYYWEDFWRNNNGLGKGGSDPDASSKMLQQYHQLLWSKQLPNGEYLELMEDFLRRAYTIGGMIIFPKRSGSINQARGCNYRIKDRWDLTLECIRKYYLGEKSPLYGVLEKDKQFFNLFIDFKGYVDFFYLQDCVSSDYSSVQFWLGNGDFSVQPLPQNVNEYLAWIDNELKFVEKRNQRIKSAIQEWE